MTTKRAATALHQAGIPDSPSALRSLVIYAAQNPGFEFRNYWTGDYWNARTDAIRAYRSDYRMALKSWQDVRTNARICASVGVTDEDIYAAQERAFSGRVTVTHQPTNSGTIDGYRVDYCTGQYFPTEYRRAIACVLDRAAEIAFQRQKSAAYSSGLMQTLRNQAAA